jgi:glycosyltransferase involved in cell wall biosynthesis
VEQDRTRQLRAECASPVRARKYRLSFVTILPSPYQRDLFAALAQREEIDLRVYYLEAAAPDSPWPQKALTEYESIIPGICLARGTLRVHINWRLPELRDSDLVVLSSFTSVTGQWLMRFALRRTPWLFWGERIRSSRGLKRIVQEALLAPLARAKGIVGIGKMAKADYQRRFPHLAHCSIPYHCDLRSFFAIHREDRSDRPITFLFCGQIIERKGADLLLAAFDGLVRQGIDVRMLLVGREADLPRFLAKVSDAGRSRISYEGFQDPDVLDLYFAKADIFVLPSRHDGWGVVVNQAMAAGMPIISTDAVGAGQDLIEPEWNGILVPANSMEALHLAMKELALRPDLITKWGKNSRQRARDITPAAGAEKWVRILDSWLGRKSA